MFTNKRRYFGINLPVFSILGYKDKVYFAGGGGGQKVGLKNSLLVYKRGMPANKLSDIINDQDTGEDLLQRMNLNLKLEIVVACSDGNAIFYKLNNEKGTLNEICRIKADFTEPDPPCLNDAKMNDQGTLVATGGDDSIVRIWDCQYDKNNNVMKVSKKFELVSHTAPVNSVDFHLTKPLIISASDDKSCRIFNLENKQLIKKLTLGGGAHDLNLKFYSALFSFDEKFIYTVANPSRGSSYLTKWEMDSENITPVVTIKAHHQPISACTMSKEGLFIGLGGCDGSVKIANLRYMSIEAEQTNLDMVVKGLDFTGDSRFLIAGTPESNFDVLQNLRPEGGLSKFFKLWVFLMLVFWIYLYIKESLFG
ncbi:hypothetical protein ABPG74_009082 [Tetrahymena malaccensis]